MTMDDFKTSRPELVTISDTERIASARLPSRVWRYHADGADEQKTTHRNKAVYDEWVFPFQVYSKATSLINAAPLATACRILILLRPLILRYVTNVDTSTTIFGKHYDVPIAVTPSAYQKLAAHGGEIDMARASRNLGSNFTVSSNATTSLEDV